jgi:hypothetical protein
MLTPPIPPLFAFTFPTGTDSKIELAYILVIHFQGLDSIYERENMKYLSCSVWLILLSMMIHFPANNIILYSS